MRSILFITIILIPFALMSMHSQSNDFDYTAAWKQIQKLEQDNRPKSILEKVEEIYKAAAKEDNRPQQVKSISYKASYLTQIEENGLDQAIDYLKERIDEGSDEVAAINKIILAEFYQSYLQNNGYRIQDRQYAKGEENKDYKEWSIRTWYTEIRKLYDAALDNYKVLDIPLDEYEAILAVDDKGNAIYDKKALEEIPNLYVLLAEKAINGLQNISHYAGQDDPLVFSDNKYLAAAEDFVKEKIDYPSSTRAGILNIYQKLLHEKMSDPAKLRIDLNRLQYVANQSSYEGANSDFVSALDQLSKKYSDIPQSAEVMVRQANNILSRNNKDSRTKALALCQLAQKNFPDSNGAKEAQNIINRIVQPELNLQAEEVYLPNESILFGMNYRNLDHAHGRIVKVDIDDLESIKNKGRKEAKKYLDKQNTIQSWDWSLKHHSDYNAVRTEYFAKALPLGTYALIVSNKKDFDGAYVYALFHVSKLSYTQVPANKNDVGVAVMDRQSGAPIANATVDFYRYAYDYNSRKSLSTKIASVQTDAKGLAYTTINDRGQVNVVIRKGNDVLNIRKYHSATYDYSGPSQQSIHLMTDRAIYRPGQTVYFKGILTNKDASGVSSVVANQKTIVTLLDANYQEVSKLELTTNDYGSISGEFALPSGGLNGRFIIQTPFGEQDIQVEEYKRPTFEVKIDTLDAEYQLGDKVKVTGSAMTFAGSSIADAQVKYTVYRTKQYPYWGYWRRGSSDRTWISNGTTITNDKGEYELAVLLKKDSDNISGAHYIYEIEVDVVDLSGEMRSASQSITVGQNPYLVKLDLSDQMDVSELNSLPLQFENYSGKALAVNGQLTITKLVEPKNVLRKRYWNELDTTLISVSDYENALAHYGTPDQSDLSKWKAGAQVLDQSFNSDGVKAIALDKKLSAGVYKIEVKTKDNVNLEKIITLTDFAKSDFPKSQLLFFKWNKTSYEPGETAILELGSPVSAEVLYFINSRDGLQPVEWKKVNHKNRIEIPITEQHRGGVSVSLSTVYIGRVDAHDLFAPVPWTNKELKISYETIRTDMLPGSEQEWKIKIDGMQSDAMAAELLVSMYDTSLDMFAERSWRHDWFQRFYNNQNMSSFGYAAVWGQEANYKWNQLKYENPKRLRYPRLMDLVRQRYYGYAQERMMSTRSDAVMVKKSAPMSAPMADQDMSSGEMMEESVEANAAFGVAAQDDGGSTKKEQKTFPIRKNLNETVFFFPHLMTDKEGRLVFSFKMNEALTTWKLRTLAHTKALQYAFDEREVTTSQPIMVFPNKPRFLRQGDEIVMTAKVSNLTDQVQNGMAKIQFVDAITQQDITNQIVQGSHSASFQMTANGSDAVQWTCRVPADLFNSVTYRITADAGDHSDGEENTVSVLTNKKLITESTPIHVKGGQDKMVIVPNLNTDDGKQAHAYTVEMTSHPAWLAIQALPYLMQSEQKCTEQIVNTYFSNALAHQIATAHPRIQAVFEEWKRKGADAMQSNLSKNEELKYAILKETPWVRQALSEEEQKRNIALLFEMNQMAQQREQMWQLLQQSQSSNGGFPWFVGGRDNWYITQYILQNLAELNELGVETDLRADWISKAVQYIDARLVETYNKLKENDADMDKDHLSAMAIHYLYVRSMYPHVEPSSAASKVMDYYYTQADQYWNKRNYYQQGLLGLAALATERNADMLSKITTALVENAKTNDELGTYWRLDNGFYWHQLPIESHATLIHFFQKKGGHDELVENAKIWLLKQKQTNHWKTGKSTAAAIHAMLMTPEGGVSDWLLASTPVEVTLGSQRLNAQGAEAGTGYIKQTFTGTEINPAMANIQVSNPNSSVAWGSAYYQYWQSLDKIKLYEDNPLTIDRTIYRIDAHADGTTAQQIKAGDTMKVGDKIKVKLRLKVDRPMEYVHLRDMRATGLEPADVISSYQWSDGLGYYQSTKDVSTDFFISYLPVGTYVLEYELRANLAGDFTSGIAHVQCMYAPEFGAHSEGGRVVVDR